MGSLDVIIYSGDLDLGLLLMIMKELIKDENNFDLFTYVCQKLFFLCSNENEFEHHCLHAGDNAGIVDEGHHM